MKLWIAIIPDNEFLGVFSSEGECWQAIVDLMKEDDYVRNWDIHPQEVELDKIHSFRFK